MDLLDMHLLRELEKGLLLIPHPYAEVGARLGVNEDEVLERIAALKKSGIIRRFRARINQRRVGIIANALVAWRIPPEESDTLGLHLSMIPGVTHCYRRRPVPGRWEYTLYTVHHGWSYDQVREDIASIAEMIGYREYIVLFSTDEYKRIPHTKADDMVGGT